MLVTVRCPICGKVLKTRAKYFFRCCGSAHDIKRYIVAENFSLKNIAKKDTQKEESDEKDEDYAIVIEDEVSNRQQNED